MTILTSKWFIAVALVLVVLIVLYFLGHKSVHAEITIAADPEKIWAELMDASSYAEWNPVLIPVEGQLKEGETLTYKMASPGGKESIVKTQVVKLQKGRLLNQYGGMPGIVTFDHKWVLEGTAGGTKVIQHEDYRGIYVLFWNPSWYERSYQKALENLKARIEK